MSKEIMSFNQKMLRSRNLSFQLFANSFEKYDPEKIGLTIFENRIKKPLEKMFEKDCRFSETSIVDADKSAPSSLYKAYHFSMFKKKSKCDDDESLIAIPYMYLNFESIKYCTEGIEIEDVEKVFLKKSGDSQKNEIGILVNSLFPIVDYYDEQSDGSGNSNQYRIVYDRISMREILKIYNIENYPLKDLYLAYDEILLNYKYNKLNKMLIEKNINLCESFICENFYRKIIERILMLKREIKNEDDEL